MPQVVPGDARRPGKFVVFVEPGIAAIVLGVITARLLVVPGEETVIAGLVRLPGQILLVLIRLAGPICR
ncbi:MAG: hypothetical protein H0U10_12550 [Chloroflexia bacterium]|nr:hypothetical protein [Chloroflexia bacterium]